jgi:hypothetical protein
MKSAQVFKCALTMLLAACSSASTGIAQDGELPPPPQPQLLEQTEIGAALDQVAQHLRENGAQSIQSVIVADDQNVITLFQSEALFTGDRRFSLRTGTILAPVDLGDGRGGLTTAYKNLHYMYDYNPVVSGACGPNHGGSRPCN